MFKVGKNQNLFTNKNLLEKKMLENFKIEKFWILNEMEIMKTILKAPNGLIHWPEWDYPPEMSFIDFLNNIAGFNFIYSWNLLNLSSFFSRLSLEWLK
jgi:hypothetical protein